MMTLVRQVIAFGERHPWGVTALLLTTYVAVCINWLNGIPSSDAVYVRLPLPLLNWAVLLLTLEIPLAAWALLLSTKRKLLGWASSIILGPVAVASSLFAFLVLLAVPTPEEGDLRSSGWFTYLEDVQVGPYRVAAYRADGGATTSWTTVVRQEWRPLPGLIVARNLLAEEAYEAELSVVSNNEVSVTIYPYGKDGQKPVFGGRDPMTIILPIRSIL
jgi:hypothetical protein